MTTTQTGTQDFVWNTGNGPVTPPGSGSQLTISGGGNKVTFVTQPLAAFTCSGNTYLYVYAKESNSLANVARMGYARVGKLSPDGSVSWFHIPTANTTEMPTTQAAYAQGPYTPTGGSTAFAAGDRIVVELFHDDSLGQTMATGYTATYTESANFFFQINETVAAQAAPTVTGLDVVTGGTAGGTTVVLTGTNFNGTSAVKFGTTAATSFTVNSNTQITAVSPAHAAGTIDVTVTTPVGTSATGAADHFTFAAGPAVTGISPSSGTSAGGTSVTVTGTGFTGASAVTFGATAAASYNVDSATQITAVSPVHAIGAVDITVTVSGATSATGAGDVFTFTTTSYAASGSAAVVSSDAGSLTAKRVASGTAPAVSSVVLSLTAKHVVSGTVAGVSGDSLSIFSKRLASGTVAGVSGVSGNTWVPIYASGTVVAISGVSGAVTDKLLAHGGVAGHSAVAGSIVAHLLASGRVGGVGGVLGNVKELIIPHVVGETAHAQEGHLNIDESGFTVVQAGHLDSDDIMMGRMNDDIT